MPETVGKKKRAGRVSVSVHLPPDTYEAIQSALDVTKETQSAFIASAALRRAREVNTRAAKKAAA